MDPNESYSCMLSAIADDEPALAGEHAEDLYCWIERGGFMPQAAIADEFTPRSLSKFLTVVMDLATQAAGPDDLE